MGDFLTGYVDGLSTRYPSQACVYVPILNSLPTLVCPICAAPVGFHNSATALLPSELAWGPSHTGVHTLASAATPSQEHHSSGQHHISACTQNDLPPAAPAPSVTVSSTARTEGLNRGAEEVRTGDLLPAGLEQAESHRLHPRSPLPHQPANQIPSSLRRRGRQPGGETKPQRLEREIQEAVSRAAHLNATGLPDEAHREELKADQLRREARRAAYKYKWQQSSRQNQAGKA